MGILSDTKGTIRDIIFDYKSKIFSISKEKKSILDEEIKKLETKKIDQIKQSLNSNE